MISWAGPVSVVWGAVEQVLFEVYLYDSMYGMYWQYVSSRGRVSEVSFESFECLSLYGY